MKLTKNLIEAMIIGTIPFILASCGGGSVTSSSTQEITTTIVNGVEVPPAPDSEENNATLVGIDSDNNGIRDDVDIKIAEDFRNNEEKYSDAQEIAVIERKILNDPTEENLMKYIKAIRCDSLNSEEYDVIVKQMLNTAERKRAYNLALTTIVFEAGAQNDCD